MRTCVHAYMRTGVYARDNTCEDGDFRLGQEQGFMLEIISCELLGISDIDKAVFRSYS